MPGKTTAKEMVAILSKNPVIKKVDIQYGSYFGFDYLDWSWLDTIRPPFEDGYNNGGQASFLVSDDQQTIINISPGYEKLGIQMKLSTIIAAYGQPDDVILIYDNVPNEGSGYKYNLTILWTKLGFDFRFYSRTRAEIDRLFSGSDMTLAVGPEFFVPGQDGYLKNYPQYTKDIFVGWQGFKGFDFYCRKRPSPTRTPDC